MAADEASHANPFNEQFVVSLLDRSPFLGAYAAVPDRSATQRAALDDPFRMACVLHFMQLWFASLQGLIQVLVACRMDDTDVHLQLRRRAGSWSEVEESDMRMVKGQRR